MDETCQHDQLFKDASSYMSEHKIPLSNEIRLRLYALFKQATVGDNTTKPKLFDLDFINSAKRNAWIKLKGLDPEDAKIQYIENVEELNVGWSRQGEYEYTPSPQEIKSTEGMGSRHVSAMAYDGHEVSDDIFGYTKNDNLEKLTEALKENPNLINTKDENGLMVLHYAVDRGHLNIVKFLVSIGADINAETDDQDTPLHLACISEQLETAKYLIQQGCDQKLVDAEGKTALQQADSSFTAQL